MDLKTASLNLGDCQSLFYNVQGSTELDFEWLAAAAAAESSMQHC